MLYQNRYRFRTLRMGKKARSVTIGERGGETIFITPKPKPVIEFNFWVLRAKLVTGFLVALAILVGGIATLFGWQGFLIICGLGFLVGFCIAGDRETSP